MYCRCLRNLISIHANDPRVMSCGTDSICFLGWWFCWLQYVLCVFSCSCEWISESQCRQGSMLTNLPTHVWFCWLGINLRNTGRPFHWADVLRTGAVALRQTSKTPTGAFQRAVIFAWPKEVPFYSSSSQLLLHVMSLTTCCPSVGYLISWFWSYFGFEVNT